MSSAKWIYVTGCDSGFGQLVVPMLADKGFKVFAGCFFDASMDKIKSDKCVPLKLDVSKEASVLEAARLIKEHLAREGGQLHGLINNAGILVQPCPTEWQAIKDFRDMFDVNVFGTVAVTQSVLPLIRASKGRIICVASIAGKVGIPTEAAYCASKHAVEGYASVLRKDMYPWGVTVHIVEPGVFKNTGLYGRFQTGLDHAWERLSPELRADYGEGHKNFIRSILGQALNELGTSDSSYVPKAYVHAMTSEQPLPVYRVGWDSKYLVPFLNMLHETTADAILTYNDGRIPYVPPAAAPKDGVLIAKARYDKGWPRFLATLIVVAYVVYRMRR